MSDSKQMVCRRFEELDDGNFDVLDELFSPKYRLHPGGGAQALSLDETKALYRYLYDAVPGLKHSIDEQLEDGDKVVTRWTATGKQAEEEVTFSGINIYTIADGLFVRSDVSWDLSPLGFAEGQSLFDRARGSAAS